MLYRLWVSNHKVQTDSCNYSLVYLLITYVIKDKPKKRNITVIPLSKWITEQQRRKRLRDSTPR
ncbi:hypothetical protein C5797_23815 [Salmonella enterica subsp. enterica serovar Enteritidis]|nr:hypothetical protein [Salmonella enterica subsp. enterica serovar Enteritidis]EEW4966913.1 hypothetical protein [Escherichia coli]EGW9605797.1 hypothetical protein [Salmonella enterica subsp. enterica serovar Enteritidis]HAJ6527717.1 hypothetical protein [Escherichia coli]